MWHLTIDTEGRTMPISSRFAITLDWQVPSEKSLPRNYTRCTCTPSTYAAAAMSARIQRMWCRCFKLVEHRLHREALRTAMRRRGKQRAGQFPPASASIWSVVAARAPAGASAFVERRVPCSTARRECVQTVGARQRRGGSCPST